MANRAESWRNRKTLILSRTDMMGLLTPAEYVACVEQAYRMHGARRFVMEPKGHIVLDKYPGEWEAMPSYIEEPEAAACKWVSIRERNRERFDLPTVFSILIYTHPETGFPLAICDGSYHTVMRTGAAAAVSVKWLARPDSTTLAIVGAGHMAEGTLATCTEVLAWKDVRVWSRSRATLARFCESQQPKYRGFDIRASLDLEAVVRGADVVVMLQGIRGYGSHRPTTALLKQFRHNLGCASAESGAEIYGKFLIRREISAWAGTGLNRRHQEFQFPYRSETGVRLSLAIDRNRDYSRCCRASAERRMRITGPSRSRVRP